jgi:hypothetical protein
MKVSYHVYEARLAYLRFPKDCDLARHFNIGPSTGHTECVDHVGDAMWPPEA